MADEEVEVDFWWFATEAALRLTLCGRRIKNRISNANTSITGCQMNAPLFSTRSSTKDTITIRRWSRGNNFKRFSFFAGAHAAKTNKYLSLLAGERSTQDHPPTFTLQGSLLLWPDPMAIECRGNWIIRCWYFHSRPTLDLLTLFIYLRVMLFFSACCREAGTQLVVRPPHLHYLGYHFDLPFNHTRP